MAELYEIGVATTATDVTLVTTAETIIITSEAVTIPYGSARVYIRAGAQFSAGTGTSTVTPRIRRGTLVTDTVIGEANALTLNTAVGTNSTYTFEVLDTVSGFGSVQYVFTLQQAGATANGTVRQATIAVFLMS